MQPKRENSKPSSETTPEHWKARADSNRPYSGLFKRSEPNIKPSSARTETGTERKQVKPGRPSKALKGIYSHGEPESLEEYHSRKASHIKPLTQSERICTQYGKQAGKNLHPIQPETISGLYKRDRKP